MGAWLGSEHSLVESTSKKDYSTPVVIRFKYKRGFKKNQKILYIPHFYAFGLQQEQKITLA